MNDSNPPNQPVLHVEMRDHVQWLVLNRPEVLNALNGELIAALSASLATAVADPGTCAVVIAGAGRAFSAGGDLKAGETLRAQHGPDAPVDHFLRPFQDFLRQIRAAPKPVIAAVQGHCLAGGLELVLACDLVVAASNAMFGDARGARGMLPALGGPWALLRAVGTFRAKELLLVGKSWDARKMQEAGLVNVVCDAAVLHKEVQELAVGFAGRAADSTALIKQMLNDEADLTWSDALTQELALNRKHLVESDAATRGLTAFRQRPRAAKS